VKENNKKKENKDGRTDKTKVIVRRFRSGTSKKAQKALKKINNVCKIFEQSVSIEPRFA
jgi:hypothetical protein